jgi:hypothetical protein
MSHAFSIKEMTDTLQGVVIGLRGAGLEEERVSPIVDGLIGDYVERGWLSPSLAPSVKDSLSFA